MAFLEQTATNLNDILVKAEAFFSANGWTTKSLTDDAAKYSGDVFTGKRYHLAKTLSTDAGNVGVFVNLRSANNQNVFAYNSWDANQRVTGIACNASRDYDAGLAWDLQPQSTSTTSASSVAGSANLRKTSAIKCHFFSGTHSGAMVMEGADQWYAILFGVTNLGVPFYCCSGGNTSNYSYRNYGRSKGMLSDYASDDYNLFAAQLWKSELNKWASTAAYGTGNMRKTTMMPPYATFANTFVLATPDVYTGNPILFPSEFISTDSATAYTPIVPMGHCPDAALINTKFLVDESVIEVGLEEWVCYRRDKDATFGNVEFGYAIRK